MFDPNYIYYRGIAISSVVSKAMEHVILDKFGHYLVSFVQQFGFKQNDDGEADALETSISWLPYRTLTCSNGTVQVQV